MNKELEIVAMEDGLWGAVTDKNGICRAGEWSISSLNTPIIATYKKRLKGIPLIVLPDIDVAVQKSQKYYPLFEDKSQVPDQLVYASRSAYINGYKAALQENKKWTDEDIKTILMVALTRDETSPWDKTSDYHREYVEKKMNMYLQSLRKLPKRVLVECDTYIIGKDGSSITPDKIPQDIGLQVNSTISYKLKTTSTPEGEVIQALEVYYE